MKDTSVNHLQLTLTSLSTIPLAISLQLWQRASRLDLSQIWIKKREQRSKRWKIQPVFFSMKYSTWKKSPFHNLDSDHSITYMKSLTRNWPTIKRLNAPSLTKSFSLLKGLLTHVHRIITAPSVGQNRQDVECKLLSLNPLQQPNVFRWTFVEENCHVSDHTLPIDISCDHLEKKKRNSSFQDLPEFLKHLCNLRWINWLRLKKNVLPPGLSQEWSGAPIVSMVARSNHRL